MKQSFRMSCAGTLIAAAFLLLACAPSSRAFEQQSATPNAPPKELVDYVREARKSGENEFKIQQNAVKSGWPEAAVNEAIAYVRSTEKPAAEPSPKPADEKTKPSNPGKTQNAPDIGSSGNSSPAALHPAGASGDAPTDKSAADGTAASHTVISRGVP